jgi:hypothetical protein
MNNTYKRNQAEVIGGEAGKERLIRIDGVKWFISDRVNIQKKTVKTVKPICPKHSMELTSSDTNVAARINGQSTLIRCDGLFLHCEEGHVIEIPRILSQETSYVLKRVEAIDFRKMQTINLDDEAVKISESKLSDQDNKYFIASQLMQSKRGLQLVVYAGKKGDKHKTEIIVEPDVKRLAFDTTDLHPNEVFAALTATFKDGSTQSIIS